MCIRDSDRLVLGLKGTMSEAELHLLRSRLNAGLRHKAAKGELRQGLPVGLDYDLDGRVVLTADEAVREAIQVVYRRFGELGSARQVLLSLRADGLLVPRRSAGEKREPHRAHRSIRLAYPGRNQIGCVDPVSYTHLDVYKRQY